jgi:hypothetical protein
MTFQPTPSTWEENSGLLPGEFNKDIIESWEETAKAKQLEIAKDIIAVFGKHGILVDIDDDDIDMILNYSRTVPAVYAGEKNGYALAKSGKARVMISLQLGNKEAFKAGADE